MAGALALCSLTPPSHFAAQIEEAAAKHSRNGDVGIAQKPGRERRAAEKESDAGAAQKPVARGRAAADTPVAAPAPANKKARPKFPSRSQYP